MKFSPKDRNKQVFNLLAELFQNATEHNVVEFPSSFTADEIEPLFQTHIWGHREILLTILLARLVDPSFKASKDFYDCNPRSLYEKPIRKLLRNYGIPHRKSGPLNVAKNSTKIDRVWAQNKRGDGIAMIVADLVSKIEKVSREDLITFAKAYVHRYLLEAERVKEMSIVLQSSEDPLFLARLSNDLIKNVPDGGSIPQLIIGLVMDYFNQGVGSPTTIAGYRDSVSATNTTSKKPGDIIESLPNALDRIYEVTVKAFDEDRMRESYESVRDCGSDATEVFVICRKEDVPVLDVEFPSAIVMGSTVHQDITYYFVDIFEWVVTHILFMNQKMRDSFYSDLILYINDFNTSKKVKVYLKTWLENFSK